MSDDKLRKIAETYPSREDIIFAYQEMEDFLRCQDIEPRKCERILRLLRRKVKLALDIEKALRKLKGKL